jgi:Uma2 family endonuclease
MAHPRRLPAGFAAPDAEEPDQHVLLHNITWDQYVALAESRGESASPRLTYLEGELEIMSPSGDHERTKTLIARLIEAYDEEREIGLIGMGSTTFRRQAKQRGLEPDECYCIGARRELPDFAIEVALRAGYIDKLAVYAGLGVAEVWFWVRSAFYVHILDGATGAYREQGRSQLLPELDLARVAELINRAGGRTDREIVADFRRSLQR